MTFARKYSILLFVSYDMREWLSGGAPPCQGGGRGFDSRLALSEKKKTCKSMSFFFRGTSVPRSSIFSASLWSAQGRRPPDVVRRLALSQDGPEKSDSRVRCARFYERCADRTKLSAGSLLTSGHISDWMHSATARQPTNAKHLAVAHRVAASKRHAVGHRVADASLPRRGMRMAPRSDSFPTSIVVTLVSIHRDNDSK